MVHMCPRCELRFTTDAELTDHLDRDHAIAPEPQPRRVLIVANETLQGSDLLAHIRAIAADQPATTFFLLVPAHGGGDSLADLRLAQARRRLRDDGFEASGEVGHSDPYHAVAQLLERESFDEIVVSTKPPGMSRWLEMDVAARLARRFEIPVSTVVASSI